MTIIPGNCSICGQTLKFTPEDLKCYQKFTAEPQDICFSCNQQHHLSFRNERMLYNRKCDFSGESIISVYSSDKPFRVYKSEYWNSDKWDGLEYGQAFNFEKNFFEQFHELQQKVPRISLINIKAENSEYCNLTYGNKNCYLVFGGDFNEDCMFGTLSMHNQDTVDCDYSNRNRLCYMLSDSIQCYDCQFTFDSKNCNNCYFISDCSNCTECILCTNLNNKSYCINNNQLGKEEYFVKKKQLITGNYLQQTKNFQYLINLRKNRIVKYAHTISSENCSGDYLKNCKSCKNTFDASESQDLKNTIFASKAKDCLNCSLLGDNAELCYNTLSILGSYNIQYSHFIIDSANTEYSEMCLNSENIFGCIGLRQKKYCILNTQYTKEEYKNLVSKIRTHMKKTTEWGKFFPKLLSCFGYNESAAFQHYPLTKEQALKAGYQWKEKDILNRYHGSDAKIPDNIKDVVYEITKQILVCQSCKKNYRIISQELGFYRKMNIPVPKICPDCRSNIRLSLRNPRRLWNRNCAKCALQLETTYDPERPETIYCEDCYVKNSY